MVQYKTEMRLLVAYPSYAFQPIKDIVYCVANSFSDYGIDTTALGVKTCSDLNDLIRSKKYTHVMVINAHDYLEVEKSFYLDKVKGVTTISYNLEQTPIDGQNSRWASMRLGEVAYYGPYFDYMMVESVCKMRAIQDLGLRVLHMDLPFHPSLVQDVEGISSIKKYDVFFAGASNERRQKLIEDLMKEGVTFAPTGSAQAYEMRNKIRWIRESKICLNLHYSEMEYFEKPRILYDIMANKGVCVTEKIAFPEVFINAKDLYMCSYANMVPLVLMLTKKYDDEIRKVGEHGYETLKNAYDYKDIVRDLLIDLKLEEESIG